MISDSDGCSGDQSSCSLPHGCAVIPSGSLHHSPEVMLLSIFVYLILNEIRTLILVCMQEVAGSARSLGLARPPAEVGDQLAAVRGRGRAARHRHAPHPAARQVSGHTPNIIFLVM